MIDQRAGEGDALRHAAGEVMWVRIGKRLECDQPHEFVDFVSFFAQHSARNEAGLDIVAHGEPWKKIRILKNETTLGARAEDFFFVHNQLAGIRKIETRDESKQCRFSATARPN